MNNKYKDNIGFPLSDESIIIDSEENLSSRELIIKALYKVISDRNIKLSIGPELDLLNVERSLVINKFEFQIVSAGLMSDEISIPTKLWVEKGTTPHFVLAALIDEDINLVCFKGIISGEELKSLAGVKSFNKKEFLINTNLFKGGIDRLLLYVRTLDINAIKKVSLPLHSENKINIKEIKDKLQKSIVIGIGIAGTIIFGPNLLRGNLVGNIASLQPNQISTFSPNTRGGSYIANNEKICLLSPYEVDSVDIIPTAKILIDRPLIYPLEPISRVSISLDGKEIWFKESIKEPINWPIKPIRRNQEYIISFIPLDSENDSEAFIKISTKSNEQIIKINPLIKKLGNDERLWINKISESFDVDKNLYLSLLFSNEMPPINKLNETKQKINESLKCD